MADRKAIGKKLRFEIFKRDSFKCQYCGRSSPDVILQVDHINPVKRGGKNDILNLITSCSDCNSGKGARCLDENSVLERQRKQLEELNERREQLQMIAKWRDEMLKLDEEQVNIIEKRLLEATGYGFSETGRKNTKAYIKKFGFKLVLESTETSISQYLSFDENEKPIPKSVDKVFDYIPRICSCIKNGENNPQFKALSYIRGIVRNRFGFDKPYIKELLNNAYNSGIDTDEIKELAKKATSWTNFRVTLEEWIDENA